MVTFPGARLLERNRRRLAAGLLLVLALSAGWRLTGQSNAVAFVQANSAATTGTISSVSASFAGAQGNGHLNVVVVGWDDPATQVLSVTDTSGNAYSLAAGPLQYPGAGTQSIYYAPNIGAAAAGANAVTATFSAAVAAPSIELLEYAGIVAVDPVEATSAATGESTAVTAFLTTSRQNTLLVAAVQARASMTAAGAGFTQRIATTRLDASALFVDDRFAAAEGTSLAAHATDTGSAWIADQSQMVIRSNRVESPNFGDARAHSTVTPPSPDYEVRADLTVNNPGWGNRAGVRGRDAGGVLGNAYEAYFSEAERRWYLDVWAGFSVTTLGTFADPDFTSGTRSVTLRMAGPAITVLIDGVPRISAANATLTSAGHPGLRGSGGIHDGILIDNVVVTGVGGTPLGFGSVQDSFAATAATYVATATLASPSPWLTQTVAFKIVEPGSLPAPTSVTAAATSSTAVELSWTGPAAATAYTVYRDGVPIATIGTTSFNDAALTPSTTYSYTVSASGDGGLVSPVSTAAVVTTPAAPDTAPPVVSIINPTDGVTVSGIVNVTASASDNVGVAGVQFALDGVLLGAEDTAGPFAVSWDTAGSSPGPHVLTATARDGAGNTAAAAAVTVTVGAEGEGGFTLANDGDKAVAAGSPVTSTITATVLPSSGSPGATTFVSDSFSGATGALLDAHAPEFGANWVNVQAAPRLLDNHLEGVNFGDVRSHNAQPLSTADYDVSADLTMNATGWGNRAGVRGRDAGGPLGNAYEAYYQESSGSWRLDKWVGFSAVNLGSFAEPFPVGTTRRLTLSMEGTAIALLVDAVPRIAVTDASLAAAGSAGLFMSGGIHDGLLLDNFAASSGAGPVAAEPVSFSVSGLPAGATAAFAPAQCSVTCASTLTITTAVTTTPGDYPIAVTGTSGSTLKTTTFILTITAPAADVQAPSVSVISPANLADVSGTITVTANASDDVGVARVQFLLDGSSLGGEVSAAPYSTTWNTAGASNGSHALGAIAFDAAGNSATSAPVMITVSNAVPDTTPPSVAITSPADGTTVSGSLTISANASDNVGVAAVQFKIDGGNLGSEDTSAPFSALWDATAAGAGQHQITAVARDAAGNATISSTVTVTSGPATPSPAAAVTDTFTAPTGTALSLHAPELGSAWVDTSASPRILDNRVEAVNFGEVRTYNSAPIGTVDYDVSADLTMNVSGWGNRGGVRGCDAGGRLGDAYEAYYDDGSHTWRLDRWSGFSVTNLGAVAQAFPPGTTRRLTLSIRGSNIAVLVDGAAIITVVDGAIAGPGRAGIYLAGGIHDGILLDNFVVVRAGSPQPPTAPGVPVVQVVSSTLVNLSWAPSADDVAVTGYRVERCEGDGCTSFTEVATPPDPSFSDAGVLPSTAYSYRVRAVDTEGNIGAYSDVAAVIMPGPDTQAPTVPGTPTAAAVNSSQISLNWNAAADNVAVAGYSLERCEGTGCTSFIQIAAPAGPAYSDKGLLPSTTYTYRVRALDAASNVSGYSGELTSSTTPPAPAPPTYVSEAHSSSDGCCGLEYNNAALTINVTGTNRLLIAAWHSEWDGTPNPAPTPPDPEAWSVTNNGVPGTLLAEADGYKGGEGNRRFRIYYWMNPPLGENIVRVSNPNTGPNELAAAALLFNNVDELDPLSVQLNASALERTSESETVNTSLTDLVLHVIANGLDNVGIVGPGETSRAIVNDNFNKGDASLWLTTKSAEEPTTTVSSSGWGNLILNAAAIVLHGNSTVR